MSVNLGRLRRTLRAFGPWSTMMLELVVFHRRVEIFRHVLSQTMNSSMNSTSLLKIGEQARESPAASIVQPVVLLRFAPIALARM